jgi:DNA-binding transcriptional ArsR family regulator
LTYSHIGIYNRSMPRAATTSDAFNAVAEPRRREILSYLALRERPVGDIAATLGIRQPSVSKHLRVLRDVGLVRVRRDGRRMLYRTDAETIRPLHEWTGQFERFWRHQLDRVKERAERKSAPEPCRTESSQPKEES